MHWRNEVMRGRSRAARRAWAAPPVLGLLDHLHLGVILVDRGGRVLWCNARACSAAGEEGGLHLDAEGRLCPENAAEAAALRALLAEATNGGGVPRADGRGAMLISRAAGEPSLMLFVTPLDADGRNGGPAAGEPAAVVFVGDPAQRARCAEPLLCRFHGLTPAEARLAALLIEGRSLDQAAEELAVTRSTARTYLKRIFTKTQTSRQGELIGLLLNSPATLCRSYAD